MKKKIMLIILIAISGASFAQSIQLGLIAGINGSTITGAPSTAYGQYVNYTGLMGYHLDLFADIPFNKHLSIRPAISLTTKGAVEHTTSMSTSTMYPVAFTYTGTNINGYFELPVNVLYHLPVATGNLFIGGGPYIAYNPDINGEVYLKPGIGGLCGYHFKKGLMVSAGYEVDLSNSSIIALVPGKNELFNISLGYSFFNNK